jgi:hypothetical protein
VRRYSACGVDFEVRVAVAMRAKPTGDGQQPKQVGDASKTLAIYLSTPAGGNGGCGAGGPGGFGDGGNGGLGSGVEITFVQSICAYQEQPCAEPTLI